MPHFDLIILGSGSGNTIVDERFADWSVAIVEKGIGPEDSYGGTCLNVGCIPSKMFVHAADVAATPRHSSELGVDLAEPHVRWQDIRDRIFGRIDAISEGGRRYRAEENANVTLYQGYSRFTGKKELTVYGAEGPETLTADRIVLAAGSRPSIPEITGIEGVWYHTSDTIMRLDALPERMIILGTGFVSAELAHVFHSLGVAITVIGRSGRMLRAEEESTSERFTEIAAQEWDLRLSRSIRSVEQDDECIRMYLDGPDAGWEAVEADQLLIATGRIPNTDLIDAATGGFELHPDGRVKVDSTQATSQDGVWAVGDVSSEHELKHVANHEARVVQHNLLHPDDPQQADHRWVPHAVFSSPQIASVGLTEQQAREREIDYVTSQQDYAGIAYGWAMEDTTGYCKLLADPNTGALLGAHIIGPQASTLVQPLIQAMVFGQHARELARGQYWIHPSMPELLENALLNLPLNEQAR